MNRNKSFFLLSNGLNDCKSKYLIYSANVSYKEMLIRKEKDGRESLRILLRISMMKNDILSIFGLFGEILGFSFQNINLTSLNEPFFIYFV